MIGSLFEKKLGTAHIAMAGAEKWEDWQVKISETYNNPLDFVKHLFFIFEDCTFIIEKGMYAVDMHTGLKKEMGKILTDVTKAIAAIYFLGHKLKESPLIIGEGKKTETVSSISKPIDFLHESDLYLKKNGYRYVGRSLEHPGWPESGRYQAAAVLFLFNHLIEKIMEFYPKKDINIMRIYAGLDILFHTYNDAMGFTSFGMLKEESQGKVPQFAIEEMEKISEKELKQSIEEMKIRAK